ncbi:MAG TPA: AAA family ATPase [Gemmatimonadales bacterium]|nr:AAA family ATPase [Gemmatimonadales bacterium]
MRVDGAAAPGLLMRRKNLTLFLYLACAGRKGRSQDQLIGVLWPDKSQGKARRSVIVALSTLRKCLGPVVITEAGQSWIDPAVLRLDTDQLEACIKAGRWRDANALLTGGTFLEGFGSTVSDFEDWLGSERRFWSRRMLDVRLRVGEAELAAGRVREAIEAAQHARRLDRSSEAAAMLLMRALFLDGDRTGALGEYEAFVTQLQEDLGTTPSDTCVELAERIRRERGAPDLPAKTPEPARRRAPLVHRDAELVALLNAAQRVRNERTAAPAMVIGDPGTGKSRLADELAARVRLSGAVTAVIRSVESDGQTPWSGVLGLARGGLLDAAGLATAPPAALAWFAGQIVEWADRFTPRQGTAETAPVRAFTEVLRAVLVEQPVMLLLDDAALLDHESLLAIEAALRDLSQTPLFVLLTVAAQSARPEIEQLRARAGRDGAGIVVRLGVLDHPGILELARWALPSFDDGRLDRVARRVLSDSAGLPLLAVELLNAIRDGLDLQRVKGEWPSPLRTLDDSLPGGLPEAVTGAIRVEFHRLSKPAQLVLQAAAVLEDRVTADRLTLATKLERATVNRAVDELEWARWLSAEGRGYSFAALIVRKVVATDLVLPGKRRAFLERIGLIEA